MLACCYLDTGLLGEAHELMVEALNLFHQVYGPLHADIATCYRYSQVTVIGSLSNNDGNNSDKGTKQ